MIRSIWLRQLQRRLFGFRPFTGTQRRNPRLRQERRPVHLHLESLEERVMPTVFNIANGDVVGLTNAILTANGDQTPDTINLAAGGTYTLTNPFSITSNGLPVITAANLTINGNGSTIQRSAAQTEFRIFEIERGTTSLNDLTIAGGAVSGTLNGGGLHIGGAVTLSNVIVQNNTCTAQGGGVYVSGGSLSIKNSLIQNNKATGAPGAPNTNGSNGEGGGVDANNATVTISNSTISHNLAEGGLGGSGNATTPATGMGGKGIGGGLDIDGSSLTMSNTTLSTNTAQGGTGGAESSGPGSGGTGGNGLGGGLYAFGSTYALVNDTVANNAAKAGPGGSGIAPGSSGVANGGGVYESSGARGSASTAAIANSTIAFNTAVGAGGFYLGGTASANIEDSTIAGNSSTGSTPASGGVGFAGVTLAAPSTLSLVNSILAANQSFSGGSDLRNDSDGGILNASNTLIQNFTAGTINGTNVGNLIGAQFNPFDPQLGPQLKNNGGPTETIAISAASPSPALGAGDPTLLPQGLTTDQRGVGFTRLVDGKLDMGAFQVQAGQISFRITPTVVFFSFAPQNVNLSATITAPGFGGGFKVSSKITTPDSASVNGGSVTFTVLGQTLTAPVVNGTANATLTIPGGTPPGTYTISIVYNGSSELRGSSTTSTLTIEPLPTSVSSVSNVSLPFTSADPPITLSAVVAAGEVGVNVGQVQFIVTNSSGGQVGQTVTANVSKGLATTVFDVPAATPLGTYTITANYMDPAGNLTSSSSTGTLTVARSNTMVVINNVNIVYGLFNEQETLTAVVYNELGQVVNEGFVTFTDGGQTATVPLVNSLATATLTIPIFFENPFAHTITVSYASSTNNFTTTTSQYTLQQTLMNYLFQLFAFMEWYKQNFPSSTTGHK